MFIYCFVLMRIFRCHREWEDSSIEYFFTNTWETKNGGGQTLVTLLGHTPIGIRQGVKKKNTNK